MVGPSGHIAGILRCFEPAVGQDEIAPAIARDVARAHGGDITVDSTPETGSHFTLTFPVTYLPSNDQRLFKII